ncbi:hypothetical protein J4Q44_G00313550 [Coregonus suidteri]|uniref:Uncharacterized protein n=1 Tax=Coregonus suidteri TaxID=861788 RepID=A0AAN8L5E5_9TELE
MSPVETWYWQKPSSQSNCRELSYSDVVGLTRICSQFTAMQVVSMLNTMYTQREARGSREDHTHNICDMALDMVRSIDHLKDASNGNNILIRVFPSVAREDEDDVKSIRSHRIKMEISGHHSLVESLEECCAEEMSLSKSHYKAPLHHNNAVQDSYIEPDSPEFDVHDSIMASPDCSEKSTMRSMS